MERREISNRGNDLPGGLVHTHLLGRVFHVSPIANLASIEGSGSIDPSCPGVEGFGSTNGFFKSRGCVSLFDLRDPSPEHLELYLWRCHPLQPAMTRDLDVAIFFLDKSAHEALVSWRLWKEEKAYMQRVVPYLEAGFPGPLSLERINQLLLIKLREREDLP